MNTKARKAKGRRLQNKVVQDLWNNLSNMHKEVNKEEIRPAIMGESGRDIKLTTNAEIYIPFDIECKNQEAWSIPTWWEQTKANTKKGRLPLLVISKNRHEPLAILRWEDLLQLLRYYNERTN